MMNQLALYCLLLGALLFGPAADDGNGRTISSETINGETVGEPSIDWKWSITAAGDYDTPLGTYYTDVDPGAGFEFRIARSVSGSTALRLSFSHFGMDFNGGAAFDIPDFVDEQLILHRMPDPHLDVYTLTAGIQCFRWIDRFRRNRTRAYFNLDIGLARHRFSGTVHVGEAGSDDELGTYEVSENDDNGLLRTGGGFVFPVGRRLQIDTGAEINLIWVRENNVEDVRQVIYGIKGYIFRMTAGLTWKI